MSHTLLLRLAGPMQSWGVQSRFTIRDTATEPTKSGVIGLCCAALGRPRDAPIEDLASLRMAVRADSEGAMRRDFHTAQNILRASAKLDRLQKKGPRKSDIMDTAISERYYLSDAHFTVGLEGDDLGLLREIHEALRRPHWPLALGRRAFVPGWPVYIPDGLRENQGLRDALIPSTGYEWQGGNGRQRPDQLRYVVEPGEDGWHENATRHTQPDQPLSFRPRRFAMRDVYTVYEKLSESEVTS